MTRSYPQRDYPPGIAMMQDEMLTRGVLWRRVFAWMMDLFLVAILWGALWMVIGMFTVLTLGLGAPLLATVSLVPAIYTWLSLVSPMQATPGQAAFGLVVVRDDDLGPPSGLQALASVVGYFATMALGAIWMAVALVTTRNRTLHDMLAGLVVVRRRAFDAPLTPPGFGGNMDGWNDREPGGSSRT